jgi:hypothetical protein
MGLLIFPAIIFDQEIKKIKNQSQKDKKNIIRDGHQKFN